MICRHWWMKRLRNFQNWKSIFVYSNTRKLSSIYAGSQKGLVKLFYSGILLKYLPSKLGIIKDRFGQLCVPFQSYKINERFNENHRWYWYLVKEKKKELWIDWKKVEHTLIRQKSKNESEIDFITWNVCLPLVFSRVLDGIFSIYEIFCYPLGISIEIGFKNNFILARSVYVLATCVHLAKVL